MITIIGKTTKSILINKMKSNNDFKKELPLKKPISKILIANDKNISYSKTGKKIFSQIAIASCNNS